MKIKIKRMDEPFACELCRELCRIERMVLCVRGRLDHASGFVGDVPILACEACARNSGHGEGDDRKNPNFVHTHTIIRRMAK